MSAISRTAAAALSMFALTAAVLTAQQANEPAQVPVNDNATAAAGSAQSPTTPGLNGEHAYSKVRIVRISEAKGEIQMDRNTGHGFEDAMTNLPIVEGCRLRTEAGAAEIEFEDNSTLRLAPGSSIEFSTLELLPSGAKVSTVNVLRGMVYASLTNTKGNEFTLTFGQQKLQLQPSSHVRLTVDQGAGEARLAVFDGTAQVESPAGTTEVGRKKTLTMPLENQGQPVLAKNVKPEAYDSWDHDSAQYHQQFAATSALASSPYSYGVSDMMYYGSFINAGGCGQMWQPYFASAEWSPFANGAWAYYPGAGYSWVSPYPWGWMPYHYGSWSYCQGAGWGWQPGGTWNGLANSPVVNGGPIAINPPRAPLNPPHSGGPTIVAVNAKPLNVSTLGPDKFVFRNDSAGMGVPRGSLGRLDKFSKGAARHGTASTPIYFEGAGAVAQSGRMENGRAGYAANMTMAPITSSMRRGYSPSVLSAESSMSAAQPSAGMSPMTSSGPATATSAARPSTGSSAGGGSHPR
jgi:hypothetical protein